MAILDKLDIETDKPTEEEIAKKFGYEDKYLNGRMSRWQKLKPKERHLKILFKTLRRFFQGWLFLCSFQGPNI